MKVSFSTKLLLTGSLTLASTLVSLGLWPSLAYAQETDADKFPYTQTFIISAYYSPLPNQAKYVTGSYAGDIRLNGDGVKAADGTQVYPGMVAAPKSYAFGTKMHIPGIGTVAVHDRGGAIVHAGERGNNHDRLDVWMGYGDEGLKRALKWGKKTVDVTVYGIDDSIVESVSFDGSNNTPPSWLTPGAVPAGDESTQTSTSDKPVQSTAQPAPVKIQGTFALGETGEHVAKVQTILKNLGYYTGEVNSTFDEATQNAVKKFQVTENIVSHEGAYGAGFVGPKTLGILATKSLVPTAHAEAVVVSSNSTFTRDLKLGDSGEDVKTLQEELKKVNFLGIEPTGYYGDVTAHAVYKFQQSQKIVSDLMTPGAGDFGEKTRLELESIMNERKKTYELIRAKSEND